MRRRLILAVILAVVGAGVGAVVTTAPAHAYLQCPHGGYTVARWHGGTTNTDTFKTTIQIEWSSFGDTNQYNAGTCTGGGVTGATLDPNTGCWTNGTFQGGGTLRSCNLLGPGFQPGPPSTYTNTVDGYYYTDPLHAGSHHDYAAGEGFYDGQYYWGCNYAGGAPVTDQFYCDVFQWM